MFSLMLLGFTSCDQDEKHSKDSHHEMVIDKDKEIAKVSEMLDLLATATESGNPDVIKSIWNNGDNTLLIGTESNEKLEGWTAIENAMRGQFDELEETLISISDQNIWLDRDARTAWFFEEMNYNFIYQDKAMSMDGIRFTGVFYKTDEGEWKLVQGHLSLPTSIDIEVE